MLKDEYKVYEEKMKKSIESVMSDFDTVRAGRANASVLNRISVDSVSYTHLVCCGCWWPCGYCFQPD